MQPDIGFRLIPGLTATQSVLAAAPKYEVPWALLNAAQKIDEAAFAKAKARGEIPARTARGKVRLKDAIALPLMAHIIREATAARGVVERADFERAGLAASQIERLSRAAYVRAVNDRPALASILGEVPPC